MKEDYLWDKTGADPEIERLENALAVFRYRETAPPALPANIIPFERETPRRFFRLSLAFASFAAMLIVCSGVWFQSSNRKTEFANNSPGIIASPIEENLSKRFPTVEPAKLIAGKIESPKQSIERKAVKIRVVAPVNNHRNNLIARKVEVKESPVKLTKEETYAYNQLMLALSITGSKLKLVKDKIDGIEEKTAVSENER